MLPYYDLQRPPLTTHPGLQWFRLKLVKTQASSLDSTKVPKILNGTTSRTRARLVERSYELSKNKLTNKSISLHH